MPQPLRIPAPRRLHAPVVALTAGIALLISACGGGGDPPTGTNGGNNNGGGNNGGGGGGGNTNVIGPPVSITLESGDAQSAEPGITLATPIAIIVRDSASKAVPSASVTIAVDSGGGTLTATTTTTGTDGRATLPTWTLGASEGPQVLRITSGAASTKARATSRIAAVSLPAQTAPAAGGTITIAQPNSVLNGLSIVVPSGGYTAAQSVAISYASSSAIVPPSGGTVASPLISVSGLENLSTRFMTITIPAKIPAGQTPVVMIKDPSSSATSTLRIISWNATSVTAAFRSLNGQNVADIKSSAPPLAETSMLTRISNSFSAVRSLFTPSLRQNGPAQVYTVTIPDTEIFKNRASSFTIADDAWNFAAIPTTLDAFTQRGMAATALNFFMNIKPLSGSLRSRRYFGPSISFHIPYGNRRSMRLVSMASQSNAVFGFGQVAPQQLTTDADWRSIAATMLLAGDNPVPVWVVTPDLSSVRVVLVYAISETNGTMFAYDPLEPAGTVAGLAFDKTTHVFLSYIPSTGAPAQTNVRLIPQSAYSFFDKTVISSLTLSVATPGFGDDKFRNAIVRSAFDSVTKVGDTTFVLDTLSMWSHCGTGCVAKGEPATFGPNPLPPNGEVLPMWFWANQTLNGPLVSITGNNVTDRRGGVRLNSTAFPEVFAGVFIQTGTCGTVEQYVCWVDAVSSAPIARIGAFIREVPDTIQPGVPTKVVDSVYLAPADAESEWDFGDGTPRQNVGTARSTTHTWNTPGDYSLKVRVYHKRSKQLIGIDSMKIKVDGCAPTFVDPRDNTTYKQTCIDKRVWMAENLRFADQSSVCYNGLATNCLTYGRLYLWKALLKGAAFSNTIPSGVQGVCMAGWHVPSMAEWDVVIAKYGGRTGAGYAFMSPNLWTNAGAGLGTNASGLNVLPSGFYRGVDGAYLLQGSLTYLASSSNTFYQSPAANMEVISLTGFNSFNRLGVAFNDDHVSVRCVRDLPLN